ncbi:MAG: hypothetical protein NUV69_01265 [Candidatus Curtissbacteria bacterium]|nr:hypothetical protein [Candidatus Curtissbacteria bacterium]
MRDLSKTQYRDHNKLASLKKYGKIFIIVAFILGVFFAVTSTFNISTPGGSAVVLREAPRGLTPVGGSSELSGVAEGGVELTKQTATLQDVEYGGEARGSATRSFGGGTYILTVSATLPDPTNNLYQVWLANGSQALPIDYMSGSKNSWSLSLRDTDKYSNYREIWITREITKDSKPELHVLEGSF